MGGQASPLHQDKNEPQTPISRCPPPVFLQEGAVLPAELQQAFSPGEWDGGTGLRVNTLTQGAGLPPPPPGSRSLHATQPAPCPGWDPSLHLPRRASGVPGPLATFGGWPFSAVLTASERQGGDCGHEDCSDGCGHPWPGSAPQGQGEDLPRMGQGLPAWREEVPGWGSPRVGTSFHLKVW